MQCTAMKLSGQPCQAAALSGEDKCHFHSDSQWEARRDAQAKGGLTTAGKIKRLIPTHLANDVPDVRLESPGDAKIVLQKVVNWTLKGDIATTVATVVINALSVFVRLTEATEVEAKIRDIEEKLQNTNEHQIEKIGRA